jgi:hypothetical protein
MKIIKLFIATAVMAAVFQGCKKDSDLPKLPEPVNEPEVITSVKITLTDSSNTANIITASFIDKDGDGGNQPTTFDTIKLKANKTYLASIEIFNHIMNEDLTEEIEEEANEHLFVFKPTGVNLSIAITDFDTNSPALPIGLKSKWRTGATGNGNLQLILKHQPDSKNGTEAPGDTDIDLNFTTTITN